VLIVSNRIAVATWALLCSTLAASANNNNCIVRPDFVRPFYARPEVARPMFDKSKLERPEHPLPLFDKPVQAKPVIDKPNFERPKFLDCAPQVARPQAYPNMQGFYPYTPIKTTSTPAQTAPNTAATAKTATPAPAEPAPQIIGFTPAKRGGYFVERPAPTTQCCGGAEK
jgi:hypothetical protein